MLAWQVHAINEAWGIALRMGPSARNKLLARHMRAAAAADPVAYELVKGDTRDLL